MKKVTKMEKNHMELAAIRSDLPAASLMKSTRNKMQMGAKMANAKATNQAAYQGTKAKFENSSGNNINTGVPTIALMSPPFSQDGHFLYSYYFDV